MNHLPMTPRLTTDYAKNYCNRILIVKVIAENVVTSFYGTQRTTVYRARILCVYAVVTLRRLRRARALTAVSTWMGDRVPAGKPKPSRYVASQLGRLSLLPSV